MVSDAPPMRALVVGLWPFHNAIRQSSSRASRLKTGRRHGETRAPEGTKPLSASWCGSREVTSGDDGGIARGHIPQAAGAECTRTPEPDGVPAQGSRHLAVLDLGRGPRDRARL